jgi:hypothetical protein
MAKLSIDELLEEQKRPVTLAVIQAIQDDGKNVLVTPWEPGTQCLCGKGIRVPRSAIKEISKTGNTVRCCRKTLQVVEIKFSEGKQIGYEELFVAIQTAREDGTIAPSNGFGNPVPLFRRLNFKLRPGGIRPWGIVGGTAAPGDPLNDPQVAADAAQAACIENCLSRVDTSGLSPQQRQTLQDTMRSLCEAMC